MFVCYLFHVNFLIFFEVWGFFRPQLPMKNTASDQDVVETRSHWVQIDSSIMVSVLWLLIAVPGSTSTTRENQAQGKKLLKQFWGLL